MTNSARRSCSVVESIDCEAPVNGLDTCPVVSCWACGNDVCRSCSSIVSYPWKGQHRRMRFCYRCQEERSVDRGARSAS